MEGVFIGSWGSRGGSSTDLVEVITHQVVAGWVERIPPPSPSSSRVDTCPQSLGSNRLKTWSAGQGAGLADRQLGPFDLGFGPFNPHVKYSLVVMMILKFGQLHFVIPWNAPIWYLSS
jgi:hypothetical protein